MPLAAVKPEGYSQQLAEKVSRFQYSLKNLPQTLPALEIFPSPESHYRLRAEFRIWHVDNSCHYAMIDPETKKPVFITDFPVASEKINQLMPPVLEAINQTPTLRNKLFQIEFLSTLTGDTLVTLIYHRPLPEEWKNAARLLQQRLGIHIIGRSRKQKLILDRDYVTETLTVNQRNFHYRQIEGGFTQPNGKVCEQMLAWAVNNSRLFGGDLLELYCGNGNFTLPLSQNFSRVVATEVAKVSVAAARKNIRDNGINNIEVLRMSSEEFVQARAKVREFRRLENIDLDDYNFSTLFVDPPRAGLDASTISLAQTFENIIYISCNPQTLLRNLHTLCRTHRITSLAAFDQFPYTPHLEVGVILSRSP